MDATYHSSPDIIYTLHNPAPTIHLVKLGHRHMEAWKTLTDIFRKAPPPPAVPLRVPVRELGQKKLQEMNQEGTQMKGSPQSNPIPNS